MYHLLINVMYNIKGAVPPEQNPPVTRSNLLSRELTIVRVAHNLNTYQLTVPDNLPQRAFTSKDYQYCRAEAAVQIINICSLSKKYYLIITP